MIANDDVNVAEKPARPVERAAPIATRAPAPRPRRLSRRAITLFAGGSAIGLAAALVLALSSSSHHTAPQETVAVAHRQPSDLLATAPKDYGAVAREKAAALGPPSSTAQPGSPVADTSATSPTRVPADGASANEHAATLQRQRQQRDSARSSKLFASSGETTRSIPAPEAQFTTASSPSSAPHAPASPANGDAQDRKAAFVASGARTPNVNGGRLTIAPGRYVVTAGSTIAAALITGLSSDLPGEVVAQVTEDVFDSTTGRTRLIPQGTRLIGSYDAHIGYGQSRALVVWTRLILPDGRSLDLDRLIGTDAAGQSGFVDRVNHHTGKLLEPDGISFEHILS